MLIEKKGNLWGCSIVPHSKEAIESAQMIAAAVFLARRIKEKDVIRWYAEQVYGYTILKGRNGYDQLREESMKYRKAKLKNLELRKIVNCSAKISVETALYAFLNAEDYRIVSGRRLP